MLQNMFLSVTSVLDWFQMTIRATDGGTDPGPIHTDVTFTLLFVPTRADPEFRPNQAEVSFFGKCS